jgi:hypothetical protein
VITITNLHVVYDAMVQGDEAVFEEYFERHIGSHDAQRERAEAEDRKAQAERSLTPRSPW